jgi:xanthine dehydrogenase accessory factor
VTKVWKSASGLQQNGTSFVVVTLVSCRGSVPQNPGAKAIITADGLIAGTIGGGKVETAAIRRAQEILKNGPAPQLLTWNLQTDIGMTCGGEVTLVFELQSNTAWQICIFGAGHVAQALIRVLRRLNCRITCVDSRIEWLNRLPKFSSLTTIGESRPADLVASMPGDAFYISVTQGHATDVPILAQIFLRHPKAPYVGVIGSAVKGKKISAELADLGVDKNLLKKLRCPIGLDIGSNDPSEIAISIVAELLQVRGPV